MGFWLYFMFISKLFTSCNNVMTKSINKNMKSLTEMNIHKFYEIIQSSAI